MRFLPIISKLRDRWFGVREGHGGRGRTDRSGPRRARSVSLNFDQLECRIVPATRIWTGLGANGNWDNPANWSGGVPVSNDDVTFPAGPTNVVTNNNLSNLVLNSIVIEGSNYVLGGNAITLGTATNGNPLIVNASAANNRINFDITLAGGAGNRQTFFVGDGGDVTVAGHVIGPIGVELAKRETGLLILGNDNSNYLGPITVIEGAVRVTHPNALGSAVSPTTVQTNAQLQFDGNLGAVAEPLLISGPGLFNDGVLWNRTGTTTNLTGNVRLDNDVTLGAAASTVLTISGQITDTGPGRSITKEGTGEIIFARDNTYRGLTTINDGILTIQSALGLGTGGTAASGTIVNRNITKVGQLRLSAPVGGPGFTVLNELLTLNGAGPGSAGALLNFQGNNTWAATVTLGSPAPNGSDVNIGAAAGTNLTISGVVQSPNGGFNLTKVGTGRLILNNSNTYTGITTVAQGILNVRDSQALGQRPTLFNPAPNPTVVANGAALELEVDNGFDAHGRNLGLDSVTGVANQLLMDEYLFITGRGVGNTGALRSVSGINTWTWTGSGLVPGPINLQGGTASIGVDPDPNASNSNLYFTNDYSLTVLTNISGGLNTTFAKLGTGHLILPNANPYQGPTNIEAGWITIQNSLALGDNVRPSPTNPNLVGSDTIQWPVTVFDGAALHLKPSTVNGTLNFNKNLVLNGVGVSHPFQLINQKGALVNLGGNNTIGGPISNRSSDIRLNGVAGIGVEILGPHTISELTITGSLYDGTGPGGITKLGSQRLNLQGDGNYSNSVTVAEGVLRVENSTALGTASSGTSTGLETYTNTTTTVSPGIRELQSISVTGSPGTFTLEFNGSFTPPIPFASSAAVVEAELNALASISGVGGSVTVNQSGNFYTVNFGGSFVGYNQNPIIAQGFGGTNVSVNTLMNGDGASLELYRENPLNTGGLTGGLEIWHEHLILNSPDNLAFGNAPLTVVGNDNLWRGPMTLGSSANIHLQPASRLTVMGGIDDAINPATGGSDLTLRGGGVLQLGGAGSYRGITHVTEGRLVVANGRALGAPGAAEVQILTVSGDPSGSFTLTFDGQTTATLDPSSGTLAEDIEDALNGLSSVLSRGGSVTVSDGGGGVFTISFLGNMFGFDQPDLQAQGFGGTNAGTITFRDGSGGTIVEDGAALELQGSITVAGEPLILHGRGAADASNVPVGWYTEGPASLNGGHTVGNQAVSGRVTSVVADFSDPNVIYIATAGGGAWKTKDGGRTWLPLFDYQNGSDEIQQITVTAATGTFDLAFNGQVATLPVGATARQVEAALNNLSTIGGLGGSVLVTQSGNLYTVTFGGNLGGANQSELIPDAAATVLTINDGMDSTAALYVGAIAIDPADPRIVYIGTGETNNSTDSFYGTGIYRTVDAGKHWTLVVNNSVQTLSVLADGGEYTLSYNGDTIPVPLNFNANSAAVEAALNALPSIANVGGLVTVTGVPAASQSVQVVTVTGTAGNFTLDFNTQLTATIAFNATAATVQTALNALTNVAAAGGVTVSLVIDSINNRRTYTITFGNTGPQTLLIPTGAGGTTATAVYSYNHTITFGGSLSGTEVPLIVTQGTNGATTTVTQTTVANPFDGKGISKIIVDRGFNPLPTNATTLYVASGDGGVGADEAQRLQLSGMNAGVTTFTLTFTGRDATGAVLSYTTAPILFQGNGTGGGARVQTAANIQAALNALPNIGGIGGSVIVTPVTVGGGGGGGGGGGNTRYNITFQGTLAQTNVIQLTGNPPPPPGSPSITITTFREGGSAKVINGTPGGAGVWRYTSTTGTWFNLTSVVSTNRASVPTTNAVANTADAFATGSLTGRSNPPNTPGPDDDYRASFPFARNEVQQITVTSGGGGSTFTLEFNGSVTGNLSANANANTIQAALNGLASIGGVGGSVTVTGTGGGGGGGGSPFTVTFGGSLALLRQPILVGTGTGANPATVTVVQVTPGGPTPATWSDIALIYTDITNTNNGSRSPVLYAALGTASGDVSNGVYWSRNPTSNAPIWYVGDPGGVFANPATNPTAVDTRSAGQFPVGQFAIPVRTAPNPPQLAVPLNGNIKIAAVAGNTLVSSTVYAATATPNRTLRNVYRTGNGGQTWAAVAAPANNTISQWDYANAILALSATDVLIGSQETNAATHVNQILRSTTSGGSWTDVSVGTNNFSPRSLVHSFYRVSATQILVGTDGGVWSWNPNTNVWTNLNGNLGISQINSVASHPTDLNISFAGVQSNGTARFNNELAWTIVDGLGGGPVMVDPKNPNNVYHIQLERGANAVLRRSFDGGITWASTTFQPFAQNVPLVLDPVNTSRLLVGGTNNLGVGVSSLMQSIDRGNTFVSLNSPMVNVTAIGAASYQGDFVADPNFTLVGDRGANTYDPDTIYITDGTFVWVTKNGGQTWTDRTTDLSGLGSIVDIVVDPTNRDVAYIVRNTFRSTANDRQVWMTTDAGQSWEDVTYDLPDLPVWTLVIDSRDGTLYIGTDLGVYKLAAGTTHWERFGAGLPNVQVRDLELNVSTNTLLAGTYGRGVYRLFLNDNRDNVGSFRAISGSSVWTGPVLIAGDAGTNTVIISAEGTQRLQNGVATAQLNIVGPISDLTPGGNATVIKTGQGNVIFSGNNTYGGFTDIQEGVLVANNPRALGDDAVGTRINPGTALELLNDLEAEPIFAEGDGIEFNGHFTGALRNVANFNTYTGQLTMLSSITIGVDSGSSLTIGSKAGLAGSGNITDNGNTFNLTKELTGTLVLASQNTYGGLTRVIQGALNVQHDDALGFGGSTANGTVVLDGAQLQIEGDVTIASERLRLSGTGIDFTGAIQNVGGINRWQGPITLARDPSNTLNEIQTLLVRGDLTGSFTLTFNGQTTSMLNATATALDIQNALLNLPNVGLAGGLVQVEQQGNRFTITFGGTLGATNLTQMTHTDFNGTEVIVGTERDGFAGTTPPTSVAFGSLFNAPGDLLTIDGQILQAVTGMGVTKVGPGTIAFNNNSNNYSSVTTISEGALRMQQTGALGTPGGPPNNGVVVNTGAALELDNVVTTPATETLTLNGHGAAEAQLLTVTGTSGTYQLEFQGALTSSLPFNAPAALIEMALNGLATIGGVGGAVSVVASGPNSFMIHFGGTLNNANQPTLLTSFAGGVTANVTPVRDGGQGALRNIAGTNTWAGAVRLASDSTIGADASTQLTVSGVVQNAPSPIVGEIAIVPSPDLTKIGAGTVIFSANNTYTGATFIDEGVLSIRHANALGGVVNEIQRVTLGGPSTGSFNLTFNGHTTSTLAATATQVDIANALLLLPSISGVGGSVSVVRTGSQIDVTFLGSLAGQNQNQMTGSAFGGVTLQITTRQDGSEGTFVADGATLEVGNNIVVTTEPLTLAGAGVSGTGALRNLLGSSNRWVGTVVLTGDTTLGVPAGGTPDSLEIFGAVVESGGSWDVTKVGTGTLILRGTTDNVYTGVTTVVDGLLTLDKTNAIAIPGDLVVGDSSGTFAIVAELQNHQIADTADLTINPNGFFDLNNRIDTVASVTIHEGLVSTGAGTTGHLTLTTLTMEGGTITLGAVGSTVTLGGDVTAVSTVVGTPTITGGGTLDLGGVVQTFIVNNGPQTIDLDIHVVIANGGIFKTGEGLLQLTGASTYAAGTTVEHGTLLVNNTSGTGTGTGSVVVLNSSLLGGTGNIAGTVDLHDAARLSPGASVESLATGSIVFRNGTFFDVEINGMAGAGVTGGHDLLDVTGTVDLGGATLVVDLTFVPLTGSQFTIIQSTGLISNQFAQGGVIYVDGMKFSIQYNDHSVVLQRIPADTSIVLNSVRLDTATQNVTFIATVTQEAAATFGAPTGQVRFYDQSGSFLVGFENLVFDSGTMTNVATLVVPLASLPVSPHDVTATYLGDSDFVGSGPSNTIFFGHQRVVDVSPVSPVLSPPTSFSSVTLTFNAPVDATTFVAADDVVLTDPFGNVIPVTLTQISSVVWQLNFTPQVTEGTYILLVGPNISDTANFPMDQNGNGINGEAIDQYEKRFVVNGLRVTGISPTTPVLGDPGLSSIDINFNIPVAVGSISVNDFVLRDQLGTVIDLSTATLTNLNPGTDTQWRLSFPAQHRPGTYTLRVGPNINDRAGNPMNQNRDGTFGDNVDAPTGDVFVGTVTVQGLKILHLTPPNPLLTPTATASVTIEFNQAVGMASFTPADFVLRDPNNNIIPLVDGLGVPLTGVSLSPVNAGVDTIWQLDFPAPSTPGVYTIQVGPDLVDRFGFGLDQNSNGIFGETPGDQLQASFVVNGLAVLSATPAVPVLGSTGLSSITLTFNMAVAVGSLTVADFSLVDPTGAIIPLVNGIGAALPGVSLTNTNPGTDTIWRLNFPTQRRPGTYILRVGPNVSDRAGNLMNQNRNTVFGEPGDALGVGLGGDVFAGSFLVQGLAVTNMTLPNPLLTPTATASALVTFNQAVALGTLTAADFTLLDPNGTVIPLVNGSGNPLPGVSVNNTNPGVNTVWRLDFPAPTVAGVYTLRVGPNVNDAFGNLMDQNFNGVLGETPGDQFDRRFVVDGLRVDSISTTPTPVLSTDTSVVVDIHFNMAVDPASFNLSDVTLLNPSGGNVLLTGATLVSTGGNNSVWQLTLPTGTRQPGNYTLRIGPDVRDVAGNQMNQTRDLVFGQANDAFTGTLFVQGLRIETLTPTNPVLTPVATASTTVQFNMAVAVGSFTAEDVTLLDPNGNVLHSAATPLAGVTVVSTNPGVDTIWQINYPAPTIAGVYTVRVGPHITDALFGVELDQNSNGTFGETPGDQRQATYVVDGLAVTGITTTPSPLLSTAAIASVTITFNMAVNPSSFALADLQLLDSLNNNVPLTGATLAATDATNTIWRLTLPSGVRRPDLYTLRIGPDVRDMGGNQMNQTRDMDFGQANDVFSGTFLIQGLQATSFTATNPVLTPAASASATITFNMGVSIGSLTAVDFTLLDPNGTVIPLVDGSGVPVSGVLVSNVNPGTNTIWRLDFPAPSTVGVYTLIAGPNINNAAGYAMDQNSNGALGETPGDQIQTRFVVDGLAVNSISTTPASLLSTAATAIVNINFNMAVDPASFDLSDLQLLDPSGANVSLAGGSVASTGGNNSVWQLTLPTGVRQPGNYTLLVGPDVRDVAGNRMNQTRDMAFGQPNDQYSGTFLIQGLAVSSFTATNPVLSAGTANALVTFNMPITVGSLSVADFTLFDPNGTAVALTGATLTPLNPGIDTEYRLDFAAPSTAGVWMLRIGPNVSDAGYNLAMDQNSNGLFGEFGVAMTGDQAEVRFVVDGLSVVSMTPTGALSSTGVSSVTLTFNMAVALGTLTTSDFVLTDPLGATVSLAGATVTNLNPGTDTIWRLDFPIQRRPGTYQLRVGPDVRDRANNPMNQTRDLFFGQGDDHFLGSFLIQGLAVTSFVPTNPVLTPATMTSATVTFNQAVAIGTLTPVDFLLLAPNGAVIPLVDGLGNPLAGVMLTNTNSGTDTVWRLDFPAPSTPGVYTLRVGPQVNDTVGHAMDQNSNGTLGQFGVAPTGDQFQTRFVVDGLAVTSISTTPNPLLSTAATAIVNINFNMAVELTSFDLSDLQLLDSAGNPVSLTGATLVPADASNTVWRLTLPPSLRQPGLYTLRVGPNVTDVAGFGMNQTRDTNLGQPNDRFQGTFLIQGLAVTSFTTTNPVLPTTTTASANITFNMAVGAGTLTAADFLLLDPNGFPIALTNPAGNPLPGVELINLNPGVDTLWRLNYPAPTIPGAYRLQLGPHVANVAGFGMDNNGNGISGEPGVGAAGDVVETRFSVQGLAVTGITPTNGAVILGGVSSITLTFNYAVDPATFTVGDIELRDATGTLVQLADGAGNPLTGVSLTNTNPGVNTIWQLDLPTLRRPGTYTVRVGPDVRDFANNPMNQNGNGSLGEGLEAPTGDRFRSTFSILGLAVVDISPSDPVLDSQGLSSVLITFNMSVQPGSFTLADLTLIGPAGNIPLTSPSSTLSSVNPGIDTLWRLDFPRQTRVGNYTLRVGPNINDLAGFAMDQNQNGVLAQIGATPTGDQYEQILGIDGLQVLAVNPDSILTIPGMSSITVTFNEGIQPNSLNGQVSLVGPNGPVLPLSFVDLTVGNTGLADTWRIQFPTQTTPGNYDLVLGQQIRSQNANMMDQDGNRTPGQVTDRYTTRFALTGPAPQPPIVSTAATSAAAATGEPPISVFVTRRRRRGDRTVFEIRVFFFNDGRVPAGSRLIVVAGRQGDRIVNADGRVRRIAPAGRQYKSLPLNNAALASQGGLVYEVTVRSTGRANLIILPILGPITGLI